MLVSFAVQTLLQTFEKKLLLLLIEPPSTQVPPPPPPMPRHLLFDTTLLLEELASTMPFSAATAKSIMLPRTWLWFEPPADAASASEMNEVTPPCCERNWLSSMVVRSSRLKLKM